MDNIYKRALRLHLRFSTPKGTLGVEEVLDFDLDALDTLAQQADEQVKAAPKISFIPTTTRQRGDSIQELRLAILKDIIETKYAEDQTRKNRAETRQRLAMLKDLEATKSNEVLLKQPLSKIRQQREALEAELQVEA